MTTSFSALGDERFVSLTTFRRTGVPVSTPVWITRDGDALLVTTPAGSGKVKRVRHTSRVSMRPCSRRGQVAEGATTVAAEAEIVSDPGAVAAASELVLAKYGLEYRIFLLIERLVARGAAERLILRLSPVS